MSYRACLSVVVPVVVLGLLIAPAAHADGLVVADARGGSLKPGQTIDAGQPLKLESGQRVTLIASNGATIKLIGPFEGVPDPSGQRNASVTDALLKLASQSTQSSATLGTVRAPEGESAPEPWLVAVASSGHRCVRPDESVVFWRPAAPAEQTLQLSPSDHAWQGQATWPASVDRLRMPASFQPQDEQAYIVALESTTSTVTLHVMPAALETDAMRAAWMLDKGCTAQAQRLIAQIK